MPGLFMDLMTRCLDGNAKARPTCDELLKLLSVWKYSLHNFDYTVGDYQHLIVSQVDEVDDVYLDTDIYRTHNIHEKAIYTSQLIDFCSLLQTNRLSESPIDDLLKSKLFLNHAISHA